MAGFPVVLDLAGRTVVVVGLGHVGSRKARSLIDIGAVVVGIDPNPGEVHAGVSLVAEAFRPDHLDTAELVMAAATPAVNREVVAAAKLRKLWVNSATEPESGNFTLPAVWRAGRLTLSVSTEGAGPGLAATLRDLGASAFGPEVETLVELMAEFRPLALESVSDVGARRRLLLNWSSPVWLERIKSDGAQAVRMTWQSQLFEVRCDPGSELP